MLVFRCNECSLICMTWPLLKGPAMWIEIIIKDLISMLPRLSGSIQASNSRSPWMVISRGEKQVLKNTPSHSSSGSSFLLNAFTDPTPTTSSSSPFHSSHTRFANVNRPTFNLHLFLNNFKTCPLLPSSPTT